MKLLHYTLNIFGFKSSHLNNIRNCKFFFIFAISDDFPEFSTFGTLHFEKSSNAVKNLDCMKKNLPNVIMALKWPLLEPKIFIVHYYLFVYVLAAADEK